MWFYQQLFWQMHFKSKLDKMSSILARLNKIYAAELSISLSPNFQ